VVSSVSNSPKLNRKRLRSVTPSESGMNGDNNQDSLHSPLSKRKKLAAERTGYSKLKQTINADDLEVVPVPAEQTGSRLASVGPADESAMEDEDDDEGDEEYEDDDFLARELGEEDWG